LDLGVSSYQLDEGPRGFSFRSDDVLDMRLDSRQPVTALEVVNGSTERDLANILWKYGEERNARRIAKAIVRVRPLRTTGELASTVDRAVGTRFVTKSLARVFQAIRIRVNNELESLKSALDGAMEVLAPQGRLVVISYHSLEDRMVKEFFRREAATTVPSLNKYIPDAAVVPRLRILTKRPVRTSAEEVEENPRGRSAKLRAAERVGIRQTL
jgi:16S rRNA (cytosine1402-N4)-methyltransferase